MDNIEKNWDEIKNTIRKEYNVSDVAYSTWIDPLKFGGSSGNTGGGSAKTVVLCNAEYS